MPAETNDARGRQPTIGEPTPSPAPAVRQDAGDGACIACALGIWLAAQVLALGLGAGGVALAARWPTPATRLALHEMALAQVLVAAMTFCWLMRDAPRAGLLAIASSWPMLILAAIVAERPTACLLAGGLYCTSWLAGLLLWSCVLRSHFRQLIGVALAVLLTAGDAIIAYLWREFGAAGTAASSSASWSGEIAVGVARGVWRQIEQPWTHLADWFAPLAILAAGALALRFRASRQQQQQ